MTNMDGLLPMDPIRPLPAPMLDDRALLSMIAAVIYATSNVAYANPVTHAVEGARKILKEVDKS